MGNARPGSRLREPGDLALETGDAFLVAFDGVERPPQLRHPPPQAVVFGFETGPVSVEAGVFSDLDTVGAGWSQDTATRCCHSGFDCWS